ncbi:MAG: PP2C family protein-serine/threonine phosphatase [Candidatus Gracilibacteria bacterium]|jgi:HAMP domain-containing protein
MDLIRKSITWKLALYLVGVFLLVSALWGYFYYVSDIKEFPVYYVIMALAAFILLLLLIYWATVSRPLGIVLREMQALLSGMIYRKIYTDRIDEIGIIAHFFNKITKGIGDVSATIIDRDRMLDELTIAAQLQKDILPKEECIIPGLEIVTKIRPATEIGGDSFDFITVKDKTYIYLGDATGHGVAAGLIVTMAHGFVEVFADSCESAYEIIVNVNKYLKQRLKKAMFMTMVMLSWDHANKKMTYVGAGHERILVYHARTGNCEVVLSGGIALGMLPDNSKIVKEQEISLEEGDHLVMYSDGITEAKSVKGELYGIERLKNSIQEYVAQYSTEGIAYHIARDVTSFMQGAVQNDDMTLMVIKRTDKSPQEQQSKKVLNIEWQE